MTEVDGIFSTREIALAIWAIGLLTWGATQRNIRKSLVGIVRTFLQRPILIIFGVMTAYVVLIVFGLHRAGFWEVRQLKDTILWAVFVGGASMFRLTAIARDSSYFKETIKDNLRLIVFIEFIVGVFVFSLPLELIIVPLATTVSLMLVFSERNEKLGSITKLLSGIMMVLGIWLLVHAVYALWMNFSSFANTQTLADFSLTPILTICFFPFLFLASRFTHHEMFLVRLRQAIKDPVLRGYAYHRAMLRFRCSVIALDRWALSLFSRNINDKSDVDRSIDRIQAMITAEKNPSPVPPTKGWSPYAAKDFLKAEGFKTRYYTSHDDKEWYASATQDVEKRSLNTIEYEIEGNREAATRLKLTLSVYQAEPPEQDLMRFVRIFKTLYEAALQQEMGEQFEDLEQPGHRWVVGNREVSIRKEVWRHREGYELEMSIAVIDIDSGANAEEKNHGRTDTEDDRICAHDRQRVSLLVHQSTERH